MELPNAEEGTRWEFIRDTRVCRLVDERTGENCGEFKIEPRVNKANVLSAASKVLANHRAYANEIAMLDALEEQYPVGGLK